MRIFIPGATGAIGRRLVPKLIERWHEVGALTRSAERELGWRPRFGSWRDGFAASIR